ncbi:disulfide bond formation protein DsbA [archaeon CG10_big_fil_rev_8_21_14_0_10_43_11]|nr:MAG: disulfide bond formation protein DsbA [archaeon CG10_big_fil_rev_8_21_14_0_10_43_11]
MNEGDEPKIEIIREKPDVSLEEEKKEPIEEEAHSKETPDSKDGEEVIEKKHAAPLNPEPKQEHKPHAPKKEIVINIEKHHIAYVLVALVFLGLGFGANLLINGQITGLSSGVDQLNIPQNSKAAQLIDDDPIKGDPKAPVTIVEFSDFQCPYCARFYSETLPQIVANYINTGKAKLVYRDFPLSFHENAQKAAEAAECADEQGMFWQMHDTLFENQNALGVASLKQYAKDLGLDSAAFDACLDSGSMTAETLADMQAGQSVGISGTPGFYVNDQLISGAQPFSVFEQAIEAALEN